MARSGKEQWVRPPVVAQEARSVAAANWTFRIVGLVSLIVVAVIIVLAFLKYSNVTGGEGGGINDGLTRPAASLLQLTPAR